LGDDDDEGTGGKKKKGKGKEKVPNGRRKRLMSDDGGSETEEDLQNGTTKRKSPVKKVSVLCYSKFDQAHLDSSYRPHGYLLTMPNRRKSKLRLNERKRRHSKRKIRRIDSNYEKRTYSRRKTSHSQLLS